MTKTTTVTREYDDTGRVVKETTVITEMVGAAWPSNPGFQPHWVSPITSYGRTSATTARTRKAVS